MSRINVGYSMDYVIRRIKNTMAGTGSAAVENGRLKN
jgi:hypothetical protein